MIGSITTDITESIYNDAMSEPLGVVMNFDNDNAFTSIMPMVKESFQYIKLALDFLIYIIIFAYGKERMTKAYRKSLRHASRRNSTNTKLPQQRPISPQAYKKKDEPLGWCPLPATSPRQNMTKVEPAVGDNTSCPFPAKSPVDGYTPNRFHPSSRLCNGDYTLTAKDGRPPNRRATGQCSRRTRTRSPSETRQSPNMRTNEISTLTSTWWIAARHSTDCSAPSRR